MTGVTDNYQVWLYPLALGWVKTQKVGPATWPLDRALLFLLCSGQAGKFAVFCNQSVVSLCCESSTLVWLFSTVRILCGTGVSRLKSKYRKWQGRDLQCAATNLLSLHCELHTMNRTGRQWNSGHRQIVGRVFTQCGLSHIKQTDASTEKILKRFSYSLH